MPCEVVKYDIAALKSILLAHSECASAVLDLKMHLVYFEDYFKTIGAATIVVEPDYVDHDYLDDFVGYYVRCFTPYRRVCTRLHFFGRQFNQAEFEALLRGEPGELTVQLFQEAYLGFVVVKPLPQTIIGRTCLQTYDDGGGRRFYPITREYKAHLGGIPLTVKRSLAFQEQDSVVAACATSALWSAFHGTALLFQHHIPSPVEITRAATDGEPSNSRTFPNHYLTPSQMARAIRDVGLEPFLVNAVDPVVLRNTVYAYLRGRVPLLLGVALYDDAPAGKPWRFVGGHAVAVTGFSLGLPDPVPEKGTGFLLEASRIDRLYVHDDGVGPFSRMVMDEKVESFDTLSGTKSLWSMHTSWRRTHAGMLGMRAVPDILLAPLYTKIRIPYDAIEKIVRQFDQFVAMLLGVISGGRLTWDIVLALGSDVKESVALEGVLTGDSRRHFLEKPLPKFVWRATARRSGTPMLDLIFDATDIQQGRLLVAKVEYDANLGGILAAVASLPAVSAQLAKSQIRHVLEAFLPQPSPATSLTPSPAAAPATSPEPVPPSNTPSSVATWPRSAVVVVAVLAMALLSMALFKGC